MGNLRARPSIVCRSNIDCDAGSVCGSDGRCGASQGDTPIVGPSITGVELQDDGLLVRGDALEAITSASLRTRDLQPVMELTIASTATDRVVAQFLPSLVPGDYTLVLTGDSGSTLAELTLALGLAGPRGAAGQEGVTGNPLDAGLDARYLGRNGDAMSGPLAISGGSETLLMDVSNLVAATGSFALSNAGPRATVSAGTRLRGRINTPPGQRLFVVQCTLRNAGPSIGAYSAALFAYAATNLGVTLPTCGAAGSTLPTGTGGNSIPLVLSNVCTSDAYQMQVSITAGSAIDMSSCAVTYGSARTLP